MISNCGCDENGRYSGGMAGDQKGNEWSVIPWYDRPWGKVLRYPDVKVGEKIAELARQAAKNGHIGYDQAQRGTYWQELKNAKYHPENIKTYCEADCSSGVLANIKAVGYLMKIKKLKEINQDGYTGNMKEILKNAGFDVLTDKKYLTSDKYLIPGDILLYEFHHTATNLDYGEKWKDTSELSVFQKNVRVGQKWLNANYGALLERTFKEKLEEDGEYGKKTRAAALAVWKDTLNRKFGTSLTPANPTFGAECKKEAKKAAVKMGSTGTFAYICELILSAKGFYSGNMDGESETMLCSAICDFKKSEALKVKEPEKEKCGSTTWSRLFNG